MDDPHLRMRPVRSDGLKRHRRGAAVDLQCGNAATSRVRRHLDRVSNDRLAEAEIVS